jgi:hypothetical protein
MVVMVVFRFLLMQALAKAEFKKQIEYTWVQQDCKPPNSVGTANPVQDFCLVFQDQDLGTEIKTYVKDGLK